MRFYFSLLFLKVTLGVHYFLAWATGNNLIAFRNVEYYSQLKYCSGFKSVGINVEVGILKKDQSNLRRADVQSNIEAMAIVAEK